MLYCGEDDEEDETSLAVFSNVGRAVGVIGGKKKRHHHGGANPGRVLDTTKIMERVFDLEDDKILLKFQRERGQILCKTVEFTCPRRSSDDVDGAAAAAAAGPAGASAELAAKQARMAAKDAKVYMVDPREESPCLKELEMVYVEQMRHQESAVARVRKIEKVLNRQLLLRDTFFTRTLSKTQEMNKLLEDRMRELSANEMEVWIFDTKRNSAVSRGRQEKEKAIKVQQKSVVDLELDYLAPYLERYADSADSLTKTQAMEVRDECLRNVRRELEEKERELQVQLDKLKQEVDMGLKLLMTADAMNTKKFYINVLETRLTRQKRHTETAYKAAEKKVKGDPRITKFLG